MDDPLRGRNNEIPIWSGCILYGFVRWSHDYYPLCIGIRCCPICWGVCSKVMKDKYIYYLSNGEKEVSSEDPYTRWVRAREDTANCWRCAQPWPHTKMCPPCMRVIESSARGSGLNEKLISAFHNEKRALAKKLSKSGLASISYQRYRAGKKNFDLHISKLTEEQVKAIVEAINDKEKSLSNEQ